MQSWDGDRWNPNIVNNPQMADEFLITCEHVPLSGTTKVRGMLTNRLGDWKVAEEPTVADRTDLNQRRPAGATCGSGYAVAYEMQTREVNWGVYLQGLDASGGRVGNVLQVADTTGDESGARIVCGSNSRRFLIVWSNQYAGGPYGVNARFMAPDGTLDPFFVVTMPFGSLDRLRPALTANSVITGGYGFLVAWEQEVERPYYPFDVYGRAVLTGSTHAPTVVK